jgi:glycosyltransferase involved in cell wall biosynthesis
MTGLRVLRVITRMNVGGPSLHVAILTTRIGPSFDTRLVAGVPSREEGDMLELRPDLAESLDGRIRILEELRRDPKPSDDIRTLRALNGIMREYRPHIVHTHLAKAGTLGRLAAIVNRVPLRIHTYHGTVFQGHFSGAAARGISLWEKTLSRRTDCLIAVSDAVADDLRRRGFPRDRIRTIRLGLDLERFLSVEPLTESRPRLLVVARLAPVKDIPLFLAAFERLRARLPEVSADIVGDGDARDELARGAPPGVSFLGNQADLPRLMERAGAVVLTSRSEGSPVALIEALSAARPVVAPAVGGIPDVLGGRGGAVMVDGRDPASFASAFERALTDRSLWREAAAGRDRVVADYGAGRLVEEMEDLYTELWERRARR